MSEKKNALFARFVKRLALFNVVILANFRTVHGLAKIFFENNEAMGALW